LVVIAAPAVCAAAVVPAYPRSTTRDLFPAVASHTYINSESISKTVPERRPLRSYDVVIVVTDESTVLASLLRSSTVPERS